MEEISYKLPTPSFDRHSLLVVSAPFSSFNLYRYDFNEAVTTPLHLSKTSVICVVLYFLGCRNASTKVRSKNFLDSHIVYTNELYKG